jgi:hypothetical protein
MKSEIISSWQASLPTCLFHLSLCSLLFGIFRVALLFICQGALFSLLFAATHSIYHVRSSLSTTIFKKFKTACFLRIYDRSLKRANAIIAK